MALTVRRGASAGPTITAISSPAGLYSADYKGWARVAFRFSEPVRVGVLTAGFVVTGSAPKRVLIRGVGPSLSGFGVSGALNDPLLKVYSGKNLIAQNDDWHSPQSVSGSQAATAAEISNAAQAVGAFPLAAGTKDAALVLTLAPGAYTATVSGANGSTGAGLVEVYQIR